MAGALRAAKQVKTAMHHDDGLVKMNMRLAVVRILIMALDEPARIATVLLDGSPRKIQLGEDPKIEIESFRGDQIPPSALTVDRQARTNAQSATATSGMIIPNKSTIAEEEIECPMEERCGRARHPVRSPRISIIDGSTRALPHLSS